MDESKNTIKESNNILEDNSQINEISKKTGIIDELEFIEDETVKFWKTPSSSRLVRGGTLDLSLNIISSLFFTVYMMMIANAPSEETALLAIIDTTGLMLRFFAYLGFAGAGEKFMSEYLVRDKDMARIYAKSAAKYNMWVTGFPLMIIATIIFLTVPSNETEHLAYLSLLIIIIFDRITSNVSIYVIGSQRLDYYAYAYFGPYCLMYVSAFITFPIYGVVGPLMSFAFARVLMLISMLIAMKKSCDFPFSDLWDWKRDYGLFWKLFRFNFLYSLANLAFALLTTTLLISAGNWLKVLTPQEISALYTISTFSNILMNLFGIVGPIMVGVSEASGVKNKKLVDNYLMIAVKFPILMSVAVLTFFIVLGPEMIEIFYGTKYIVTGMLIMACLMPSYAFGSFASKYDNILAGVGRPETVVFPWFIGIIIALLGLFTATFLPETYITNNIIMEVIMVDGVETIVERNYGLSVRFVYTLISTSLGLLISGIWVVKICLKVLGVKIPTDFIWKPISVSLIVGTITYMIMKVLPVRDTFDELFGTLVGGIVFTIVAVIFGIFLYISIGLIFDMMNLEDGKFWKNIVEGLGPAKFLLKPVFAYCRFLLNHQIEYFKKEPIEWVLKTDKKTIKSDRQFKIKIIPLTKTCCVTEKGVKITPNQELQFKIQVSKMKTDLYNIIAYAKIGFSKLEDSLIGLERIKKKKGAEMVVTFKVPDGLLVGSHDLFIIFEAYETPRDDMENYDYFKKGLWAYFDYRMRWYHEEEYHIYYEKE